MGARGGRGRRAAGLTATDTLPRYLTSFVGRKGDLAAIRKLLFETRLLTFTGPGGSGKTRLATEVARSIRERWNDGVRWVDLAPVEDNRQVAGTVLAALQLQRRGAPQRAINSWLEGKTALLVLDNCERVVGACAELCEASLSHCPGLTVIATSREPLGVPGETQWSVLPLPNEDAVRLFEARARLVRPQFALNAANTDLVAEICRRVDELPLAVEMAASRLGMMTELEILHQLSDRFKFLTGGIRAAPERQRTMMATIDWSYRLLSDNEARFYRRLSVFRGGFTVDSATAVCGHDLNAGLLEVLSGLVMKSMVVSEIVADGTRYRLLESQLAYAEERLRTAGEFEPTRGRHYEYFRSALASRTRTITGTRAGIITEAIDEHWKRREAPNLWAALTWARDNVDDHGLSLAVDMAMIESIDLNDIRATLADLLEASHAYGTLRVEATIWLAWLAWKQGDYSGALAVARPAVAIARQVGEAENIALALNVFATIQGTVRDFSSAETALNEALDIARGTGNDLLVNTVRNSIGCLLIERDASAAREILLECVAASKALHDTHGTCSYLESLANAQLMVGDYRAAERSWKESLSLSSELGDQANIISCLHGLSSTATEGHDDLRALRLAAAANRRSREWSIADQPLIVDRLQKTIDRSRARLGESRSHAAWQEGEALTLDRVIDYSLDDRGFALPAKGAPLSRRELEVARLIAAGMTNREIAEKLFISARTAEGHAEGIRGKLGLRSRTEIAAWMFENGFAEDKKERGPRTGAPSTQTTQRS
jgi:predicted ATPase/DNA-binding CsgD family transcriptional regulator